MSNRLLMWFIVGAFAAAVSVDIMVGRSGAFEIIALVILLVGLRFAARSLKKE